MTGENFIRCSGNSMKEIKSLKEKLQNAKVEFTQYISKNNMDLLGDNWSCNKANELEKQVEILDYELYCAEYEDNRRRNWKR